MPLPIEELVRSIDTLRPFDGRSRAAQSIVDRRLYLAKGPGESHELFIEGERESFGDMVVGRGLEWDQYHDRITGRMIPSLVVRTSAGEDNARLLAHITYEATRAIEQDPGIQNQAVLDRIESFLPLVTRTMMLSPPEQAGLLGELLFLYELLNFVEENTPQLRQQEALEAWRGWERARRDFFRNSMAIEVKSTGSGRRIHRISRLEQMWRDETDAEERLYVYSVGLRSDPSINFKLVDMVERVENLLVPSLRDGYWGALEQYGAHGYRRAHTNQYRLERGFENMLPGELIEITGGVDLLRLSSFVGEALPERVSNVSYEFDFTGLPILRGEERRRLLFRLLSR